MKRASQLPHRKIPVSIFFHLFAGYGLQPLGFNALSKNFFSKNVKIFTFLEKKAEFEIPPS